MWTSFLQAEEWGALQERLGKRVIRLRGAGWLAQVIEQPLPFRRCYWYAPRGPVSRDLTAAIRGLTDAAAEQAAGKRPLFIRIEPPIAASTATAVSTASGAT